MPQELAWLWFTFQTSTLTFLLLIGRFGSTAESMRSENIRSHLRTTRSRRNNNIYMFDDVAGFFQLCTCQCYTWKYQMKDSLSRDNLWFACTRLFNASRIHMNVVYISNLHCNVPATSDWRIYFCRNSTISANTFTLQVEQTTVCICLTAFIFAFTNAAQKGYQMTGRLCQYNLWFEGN